ncbi:MAG: hypothetical protein ABI053_04960 [Lacisediminihabitans sp.]
MMTRWARVARGFVAAITSLFVAAISHILPGGDAPGMVALVACLILSTFVCTALSGKKLSLFRLSTAVIASQFLFHSFFSLSASAPSVAMGSTSFTHVGHVQEHFVVLGSSGVASMGTGMWVAHTVAAVVTIMALRYGETAFWSLRIVARLWIGALFEAGTSPRPVEVPATEAPRECLALPHERILPLSPLRRRGPPGFQAIAV